MDDIFRIRRILDDRESDHVGRSEVHPNDLRERVSVSSAGIRENCLIDWSHALVRQVPAANRDLSAVTEAQGPILRSCVVGGCSFPVVLLRDDR